jgi:class 3 adenylate cyclase/predicted ATPase
LDSKNGPVRHRPCLLCSGLAEQQNKSEDDETMNCHHCGTTNPDKAKFCSECGARLQPDRSDEGVPHRLSWLSADEDAERRQLTILFCDLVGSTNLSSTLDPEDVRELIKEYHACARKIVGQHSGFIARFFGDGVLAYFGYPQAGEDDAERAVRAGLSLVESVGKIRREGTSLSVRIGIATGLTVLSDLVTSGGEHERSAVGETPNLAARLQGIAAPHTVIIAPMTRRLVGELFEYRELSPIPLKGFAQPIRATQVLGERRLESRYEGLHSAHTSLVGRDLEYQKLCQLWQLASEGSGQVALVLGEAGIGKSRLVASIEEHVSSYPHVKLRFVCSPQYAVSPLHPVIDRIEKLAWFNPSDTPDQKLEKLKTVLLPTSPSPEDLALIADLLSVPSPRTPASSMPLEQRRERTLAALIERLRICAEQHPALVIWDDVHWIDATSQALLDALVSQTRFASIMVVITSRPGFLPSWRQQRNVTSLVLERLAEGEIEAIAESITDGKKLPPEVMEQIIERTDGVPLFVEELTKTIIESGLLQEQSDRYVLTGPLPPMAVPNTLQASLIARLDRLAPFREIAQVGAAIGREFSFNLLRAVTRLDEEPLVRALARLRDANLLLLREELPQKIYAFKHALVQQAAYSMLVREKRRSIHAQIVEALENDFPDLAAAQPEVVAQHCQNAQLWTKAIDHYQRAANHALTRCAAIESVSHIDKGLKLLGNLTPDESIAGRELALQLALGRAQILVRGEFADETGAAFVRAQELCRKTGRKDLLFEILDGLCVHYFSRRELSKTISVAQELLVLGDGECERKITITGLRAFASASFLLGNFAVSRESFGQLLRLYQDQEDIDLAARTRVSPQVSSLAYLSLCTLIEGRFDQSISYKEQSIRAARAQSDPASLILALRLAAFRSGVLADWREMRDVATQLLALAEKYRFQPPASEARFFINWSAFQLGQGADKIACLRQHMTEFSVVSLPFFQTAVATVEASVGNSAEADAMFAHALQVPEATNERWYIAEVIRQRAEARARSGEPKDGVIERDLHVALKTAREQGAKLWQLRAAVSLARIWIRQGRPAEARDLVRPLYSQFREGLNTPDLIAAQEFAAT